jgi:hypothetical protein
LERVIKDRYKKLSDNFSKTNVAFESLAKESVREKKRKTKTRQRLQQPAVSYQAPQKQIRGLKQKLKQRSHPDLKVLAQVAVNMQGEKSDAH